MMALLIRWIARGISRRLSARRINRAFTKLPVIRPRAQRIAENPSPVTVTALQYRARLYRNADALVADIDHVMAKAAAAGAELICFPELFGMLLLTLSPIVRLAGRLMRRRLWKSTGVGDNAVSETAGTQALQLAVLAAPFTYLPGRFSELMSRFAVRYGVWLSAGTIFAPENGKLYNRHLLFGPDGGLLGQADKLHLTAEEQAMGLTAGAELPVIATPVGNIALMVCMDATYYETFHIAKQHGADYVVVPIGDFFADFADPMARRGAQARVSETGLTAVKAALVSQAEDFPLPFTGRAGIYFPLESGFESIEAENYNQSAAITTQIDLLALRAMQPSIFCRRNAIFDRRCTEALIAAAESGAGDS